MKMLKIEKIIELLIERNSLNLVQTMTEFELSESTVRRYFSEIEKLGVGSRVHGGIVYSGKKEFEFYSKQSFMHEEKVVIAKKAYEHIEDNMMIFLDAGSSAFELAKLIKRNVTVVTNGIGHIDVLLASNVDVVVIGGRVKNSTHAVTGLSAYLMLSEFRFDISFLGVNSIHNNSLLTTNEEEAKIKEMVIKNSKETYVLADSSKFNSISNYMFGNTDDVSIVGEEI